MADWDDDDFDVDAIEEAALKAKKKAELDDLGLSDEEEKAEQVRAEAAARPKPKHKNEKKPEPVYEAPLLDKAAEKARRKKAQEEFDARMGADAFSGFEVGANGAAPAAGSGKVVVEAARPKKPEVVVIDAWDMVELNSHKDIDDLMIQIGEKIDKGKQKGSALKFLVDSLKALDDNLELDELESIDKNLTKTIRELKTQKATKAGSEVKGNTNIKNKANLAKSGAAELDVVYGGADDWDEWDDEDWAEWEKKQAAK